MPRISIVSERIIRLNYTTMTDKKLSELTGMSAHTIAAWRRNHKLLKHRSYTEMEVYMLQNFSPKNAHQFIVDKSINSIKIKKCRLKNIIL